jgi:hypothetical protein
MMRTAPATSSKSVVLISDTHLGLHDGYDVVPLNAAAAQRARPGPEGAIVVVTRLENYSHVVRLSHAHWEHDAPLIAVRLADFSEMAPYPAHVLLDVQREHVDALVRLLVGAFGGGILEVKMWPVVGGFRRQQRVSWHRTDPRPGPALSSLRSARATDMASWIIAGVPTTIVEDWENAASQSGFGRILAVPMGDTSSADVLVFEDAVDEIRSDECHLMVPLMHPHDPRRHHASLLAPLDLDGAAHRLSEAHLLHGSWESTLGAVRAAARTKIVMATSKEDVGPLAELAALVLELLGHPASDDDSSLMALKALAEGEPDIGW